MSYETSKWMDLTKGTKGKPPFSAGYVDNASDLQIMDNQSPYLLNGRLDGYGTMIRSGYSLTNTFTVGSYPKGIGTYIRAVTANNRIVVRHNTDATHKLYVVDAAYNQTSITTGSDIASNNRMNFTNGVEIVYCMNGSDLFASLSGTTYATITANVPSSFAPAFSVIFNGSQWASGWPTNPLTVYKSVGQNFSDFSSSGSDSLKMPEPVTGLSVANETLYYFTLNTVSATTISDIIDVAGTLTYITRPITAKEGAINHNSIVSVGQSTYYLTPSNKIVKIRRGANIDGFEVIELSERPYAGISTLMQSLSSDQSASFAYYYQPTNLIKWHLKSDGATFNDVCIVYDITKDEFMVDSQKFFYGGTMFEGNAYTISMIEPKMFQDEFSQDDEDSAINFVRWTKEYNLGEPTRKKLLWEARTYGRINELAELVCDIYIDGNQVDTFTIDSDNIDLSVSGIGSLPVGEFPIGEEVDALSPDSMREFTLLRTKGDLNVKGRKIQFRYSCNTLAAKAILLDLQFKLELLPELSTPLTT